jgi:hypothetical protein
MEHELSVKPPCSFETLDRGIVEFLNAEVPNTNWRGNCKKKPGYNKE